MSDIDYSFITDRLAVGNVASRIVPGFVAVVSLLATSPWDELYKAPFIPGGVLIRQPTILHLQHEVLPVGALPVLHIDINDGEGPGSPIGDGRDLADSLDSVTDFIAYYIRQGRVLVHCGAGQSRSGAVAVAYLCRYAGMNYSEALAFVRDKRHCVAPANCFADAVKRWLRLDNLAEYGPHHA